MKFATPDPALVLDGEPYTGSRADQTDSHSQRPVFTLDAELGVVVEANTLGWALWSVDGPQMGRRTAIDRAMPALRHLTGLPCARVMRTQEILTFWTPRGVRQLRCTVRRTEPGRSVFAIEVQGDAEGSALPLVDELEIPQQEDATRRLAHELRTPLSAVIAYAEVLKDEHFGPHGNARYREYAGNIYDSARHALGVVDGMLACKPASDGVPELVFADLDPRVVVENCIAVARPLADQAGLDIACEMALRAPRIVADEVSLKQMLLNLLTNAIKFARRGDRITVGVTYELGGPLRIAVTDTGPGMREPPLALEGGKGASRRGVNTGAEGHGIGLPLTQSLAEANGAALVIESAPGRGTRVTIAFGKDRVVPV